MKKWVCICVKRWEKYVDRKEKGIKMLHNNQMSAAYAFDIHGLINVQLASSSFSLMIGK